MAWRIHSWSHESGTGSVVSPHFGPLPFGPAANTQGTTDFAPGEEVFVELDGPKEAYVVRSVMLARQRQPEGTRWPPFDVVSGCGDMRLQERADDHLRFWMGDCCEWCAPAWALTFSRVTSVVGLDDDDPVLDSPLLRLASSEEVLALALHVPPGSRAYCVVTSHGQGRDGPRVLVVAGEASVEALPRAT
jgi:hypothetical protein